MPIAELVLGNSCTSVSTRMDTKYLPVGLRLIVAFKIRPSTSLDFAKRTNPSLGSFILLPSIAIFPFVYLVV